MRISSTRSFKILSLLLLFSFSFVNVFGKWAYAQESLKRRKLESALKIDIPYEYGQVVDSYTPHGASEPPAIILTDLHANYRVQENISGIIKHLSNNYDVGLIGVEGTSGPVDMSIIESIADKKLREKTIEYFMRHGIVTGAQAYASYHESSPPMVGIEDSDLYKKNKNELIESFNYRSEIIKILDNIRRHLVSMEKKNLSSGLRRYIDHVILYRQEKLDTAFFHRYLTGWSEKAGVKIEDISPEYYRYMRLNRKRRVINEDRVEKQYSRLLDELGVKEGQMNPTSGIVMGLASFFSNPRSLREKMREKIYSDSSYSALKEYIELLRLSKNINTCSIVEEENKVITEISRGLSESNLHDDILYVREHYHLLVKYLLNQITRDELKRFYGGRQEFNQRLDRLARGGIKGSADIRALFSDLNPYRDKMRMFYQTAIKREDSFANIVSANEKKGNVIMVVGGFHAEGVAALLKERNQPYVTINPRVLKQSREDMRVYYDYLQSELSTDYGELVSDTLALHNFLKEEPVRNRIVARLTGDMLRRDGIRLEDILKEIKENNLRMNSLVEGYEYDVGFGYEPGSDNINITLSLPLKGGREKVNILFNRNSGEIEVSGDELSTAFVTRPDPEEIINILKSRSGDTSPGLIKRISSRAAETASAGLSYMSSALSSILSVIYSIPSGVSEIPSRFAGIYKSFINTAKPVAATLFPEYSFFIREIFSLSPEKKLHDHVKALRSPNPETVEDAMVKLLEAGEAATELLVEALENSGNEFPEEEIQILGQAGALNAIDAIVEQLKKAEKEEEIKIIEQALIKIIEERRNEVRLKQESAEIISLYASPKFISRLYSLGLLYYSSEKSSGGYEELSFLSKGQGIIRGDKESAWPAGLIKAECDQLLEDIPKIIKSELQSKMQIDGLKLLVKADPDREESRVEKDYGIVRLFLGKDVLHEPGKVESVFFREMFSQSLTALMLDDYDKLTEASAFNENAYFKLNLIKRLLNRKKYIESFFKLLTEKDIGANPFLKYKNDEKKLQKGIYECRKYLQSKSKGIDDFSQSDIFEILISEEISPDILIFLYIHMLYKRNFRYNDSDAGAVIKKISAVDVFKYPSLAVLRNVVKDFILGGEVEVEDSYGEERKKEFHFFDSTQEMKEMKKRILNAARSGDEVEFKSELRMFISYILPLSEEQLERDVELFIKNYRFPEDLKNKGKIQITDEEILKNVIMQLLELRIGNEAFGTIAMKLSARFGGGKIPYIRIIDEKPPPKESEYDYGFFKPSEKDLYNPEQGEDVIAQLFSLNRRDRRYYHRGAADIRLVSALGITVGFAGLVFLFNVSPLFSFIGLISLIGTLGFVFARLFSSKSEEKDLNSDSFPTDGTINMKMLTFGDRFAKIKTPEGSAWTEELIRNECDQVLKNIPLNTLGDLGGKLFTAHMRLFIKIDPDRNESSVKKDYGIVRLFLGKDILYEPGKIDSVTFAEMFSESLSAVILDDYDRLKEASVFNENAYFKLNLIKMILNRKNYLKSYYKFLHRHKWSKETYSIVENEQKWDEIKIKLIKEMENYTEDTEAISQFEIFIHLMNDEIDPYLLIFKYIYMLENKVWVTEMDIYSIIKEIADLDVFEYSSLASRRNIFKEFVLNGKVEFYDIDEKERVTKKKFDFFDDTEKFNELKENLRNAKNADSFYSILENIISEILPLSEEERTKAIIDYISANYFENFQGEEEEFDEFLKDLMERNIGSGAYEYMLEKLSGVEDSVQTADEIRALEESPRWAADKLFIMQPRGDKEGFINLKILLAAGGIISGIGAYLYLFSLNAVFVTVIAAAFSSIIGAVLIYHIIRRIRERAPPAKRKLESAFADRLFRVISFTAGLTFFVLILYFTGNLDWYMQLKSAVPEGSILYLPAAGLDALTGVFFWGPADAIGQYLNQGSNIRI
ncbi:MAG: hypothetical protein ACQESB_04890, partial [Elusimicrobiota bacterium]